MTRGFNLDPDPIRRISLIMIIAVGLLLVAGVGAGIWIGTGGLGSHPTPQTIYVFTTPPPTASPAATPTPSPTPPPTPAATPVAAGSAGA